MAMAHMQSLLIHDVSIYDLGLEAGLIGFSRVLNPGPFDLESPALPSELSCFNYGKDLFISIDRVPSFYY